MKRFRGNRKNFKDRRNGGIGSFTPDNVPVFDWIMPNAYMIADSNHGLKMTGVGNLVAKILPGDNRVAELEPFAFSRFAQGRTFGAPNRPEERRVRKDCVSTFSSQWSPTH